MLTDTATRTDVSLLGTEATASASKITNQTQKVDLSGLTGP